MKTTLISVIIIIFTVLINTQVVDNRDYPEDAHEVYMFGHHIGQLDTKHKEFKYIRTGKRL